MSQTVRKPVVAIIDSKSLRRAIIASFLEPWANSNDLRLITFDLDQAREALHAETNLRMVILNVGGESIAVQDNLQQLEALRELVAGVPFTVISDREDAQEIAAALGSETNGFIHSGIDVELAREALSFILHGGSYFPPSVVHQLRTQLERLENHGAIPPNSFELGSNHPGHGTLANSVENFGSQPKNLTVRQQQVLQHVRLGESNKVIARELGMVDATVKVHIRQLLRKLGASNRTQLALGQSLATDGSVADDNALAERSAERNDGTSFSAERALHRERTLRLITPPVQGRRRDR